MKETIESILNEELDKIEPTSNDEKLVKEIELRIKEQNEKISREERERLIREYIKNNNIESIDQIPEDEIKEILNN